MAGTEISWEEVKKHNKADDAWVVVDGDIYDVTRFASLHPGGELLLLEYAGKDATEDFFGLHRLEVSPLSLVFKIFFGRPNLSLCFFRFSTNFLACAKDVFKVLENPPPRTLSSLAEFPWFPLVIPVICKV
eukprot:Lithocolla_globosa_v1_NODE_2945_length_1815_cov_5.456250.p4 type:complete len:131 gc:universal NODE_2945_length_1815_cov_5.456250:1719-1327(-)